MSRLLDPKIMMAIKDLSLAAKTTVDGFMIGINKSTLKGPGPEFSQYRSYQPGDDLRWLDWKMYARSDRYYVRESEIETNISIRFVMDASNSMNHNDGQFTKMQYAKYLAASLSWLATSQGDAIGLYVSENGSLFSLPAKNDYQHLARILFRLETIQPGGRFTDPVTYREVFSGVHRRELMIFITDMYQENTEIYDLLNSLISLKHEIIVFQIMGRNELDLDFKGYTTLEDLETGKTIQIDGTKSANDYQEKLNKHLNEVRTFMLDRKIVYRMLVMDQPLDEALRDFLNQRNKLIK